jgi:hypothetical protein
MDERSMTDAPQTKRERQLEKIVRRLMPATRDVIWCALVWNDHNFSVQDLLDKADRAAKALGYERRGPEDAVEAVNDLLAHVDSVLRTKP